MLDLIGGAEGGFIVKEPFVPEMLREWLAFVFDGSATVRSTGALIDPAAVGGDFGPRSLKSVRGFVTGLERAPNCFIMAL